MDFISVETLGWLAFFFLLIGYYLNSQFDKNCFYYWALGNILYAIYGFSVNAVPIIATSILILGMNIYGYINWDKIKKIS